MRMIVESVRSEKAKIKKSSYSIRNFAILALKKITKLGRKDNFPRK